MSELAGRGLAILMISSELPEILGMSDRIAVMHGGTIVGGARPRRGDPGSDPGAGAGPRARRPRRAGVPFMIGDTGVSSRSPWLTRIILLLLAALALRGSFAPTRFAPSWSATPRCWLRRWG